MFFLHFVYIPICPSSVSFVQLYRYDPLPKRYRRCICCEDLPGQSPVPTSLDPFAGGTHRSHRKTSQGSLPLSVPDLARTLHPTSRSKVASVGAARKSKAAPVGAASKSLIFRVTRQRINAYPGKAGNTAPSAKKHKLPADHSRPAPCDRRNHPAPRAGPAAMPRYRASPA